MSTLMELANVGRTVKIGDHSLNVMGVSAEGFVAILARFPVIMKMMSGSDLNLSPADIMKLAPEAVAAFIAASCGDAGNPEAEKVAGKLPLQAQLDILEVAIKQTFPQGVGPFVEKLAALGLLVQVEKAPLPSSQELSSSLKKADTPT